MKVFLKVYNCVILPIGHALIVHCWLQTRDLEVGLMKNGNECEYRITTIVLHELDVEKFLPI